jgi:hypothetical protein
LATRDCGNKIAILKLPELITERQENNKRKMELGEVEAAFPMYLQDVTCL